MEIQKAESDQNQVLCRVHTTVFHVMEKNNVFLDVILVKPALHTHDREKKVLEQSVVMYNTYYGTIKGKFH